MSSSPLQDFMISRTRVRMMELFLNNPDEMYYVREITRQTKEEINAVRRELDRMHGYGLLKSEQRGNRLYYFVNKKYVFFHELLQIVAKTTGLGKEIRKNLKKLGDVEFVMFSGRFVENQPPRQGELDVLVIGDIVLAELQQIMEKAQERLEREINYTVFSGEEFKFRKTRRDPFVLDALYNSRVMIVGNDTDFAERQIPGM